MKKNVCIKGKLMRWSDNEACLVSRKLRRPQTRSTANLYYLMLFGLPMLPVSPLFIHCLLNSFPIPQSSCCRFSLLAPSNLIMSPPWAEEPVLLSGLQAPGSSSRVFPLSLGVCCPSCFIPHLSLFHSHHREKGHLDFYDWIICVLTTTIFFNTFHKTIQLRISLISLLYSWSSPSFIFLKNFILCICCLHWRLCIMCVPDAYRDKKKL